MGEATVSETPTLKRATVLTSSLISISYSIRVFTAKWSLIRVKLDDLFSHLGAIENCEPIENLSLSIAVEAVLATLEDCQELANRCLRSSYSGKLLMQSDLDVLSSKLDGCVRSLSEIYSAGLLKQNNALIVSKPNFSASKEDVKFYAGDILSRLKIGSNEMKKQALISLNESIQEDERYAKLALEIEGFIGVLVNFLDSSDSEIQEEAAKSVSVVSVSNSGKNVLISAGIISPLIRILESSSSSSKSETKRYALRCLAYVTENSDNAWAVSSHGGVTSLLKICRESSLYGADLVCSSCLVLKNIVGVEEIKRFTVEEGAISDLITLAKSGNEDLQMCSLDLLQAIAYRDESVRKAIKSQGGIQILLEILDPKSYAASTKAREVALKSIASTFISDIQLMNSHHPFMDYILHYLQRGDISIQEPALKCASRLCGASEESKRAMGDSGFISALVKLLDSKSLDVRDRAAETLSDLLAVSRNQKKFMENEENVELVMQMLDPNESKSSNRKALLSVLRLLIKNSSSARKKIGGSEYLRNIEILAEADVLDAKKIVKKVSSGNRFRTILNGLWNP